MSSFASKEQVAKLSEEQQEVVARIALDEARTRRKVLAKAKNYHASMLVPKLALLAGLGFWIWAEESPMLIPLLFLAALFYVEAHARGLNARIDAMMELLDLERTADEIGQSARMRNDEGSGE